MEGYDDQGMEIIFDIMDMYLNFGMQFLAAIFTDRDG